MVKIRPIEGITYNEEMDATQLVAPPYDVISDEYRDELYARSPYNFVRLILAKGSTDPNDAANRYEAAAKDYSEWLEKNVLVKAQKPCIYYIIQNYINEKGQKISRKGFIARNKIEDFDTKNILPHEYTMGGPKQDRLNLMKECKTNFSQVFMVYSDPEKEIEKAVKLPETPFMDVTDDQGVQNIVYIIDDEETIEKIQQTLNDKTLLIADGHHRYETAIAYRNYRREQEPDAPEDAPFNYVMSYFTNLDDPNLIVYPTHRIITKKFDAYTLLEGIKKYFDVVDFTFDSFTKASTKEKFIADLETSALETISMGLYLKNVNKFYLLKLREKSAVNEILENNGIPDELKKLDLSVLHEVIVSGLLNFSKEEQMKQLGIEYIKKEKEAFDAIDSGYAEAVFLMASPKISDIKEISQAGYRMPQKSTYFYPKLLSGVVINPLA